MKINDIVNRAVPPVPWEEGDKIPWNDPDFSRRMLEWHLSQETDAASRRAKIIDQQVDWIHQTLLQGKPGKILDLGCGPGLYSHRLTQLGHTCTGIDFSPASIEYAQAQAKAAGLEISYQLEDIRQAAYGSGHQLAMLIFGEFNVFHPRDIRQILAKTHAALDDGGLLLIEPHYFSFVKEYAGNSPSWNSEQSGLFSTEPHLVLNEHFWDKGEKTATRRTYIIEAESGAVSDHVETMQAYTNDEYRELLSDCGFKNIRFYPSMGGAENGFAHVLFVIVAEVSND